MAKKRTFITKGLPCVPQKEVDELNAKLRAEEEKLTPKVKRTVVVRIGNQTIAVECPKKKLSIRIGGLIDANDIFINGVKYIPAFLANN